MKQDHGIFYYIFVYPFVWIYQQLEYVFYVYIYPIWSGAPVVKGWDPKFVRESNIGPWMPSAPIDVNFKEFIKMTNQDLMDIGMERTKAGFLRRMATPQMYYANPDKALVMGEQAKKFYDKIVAEKQEEYTKKITLDPFSTENIKYFKDIRYNEIDLLSYNIQMNVKLLSTYTIDVVELFLSVIFLLVILLLYFIFYHLYKLHLKLKRAEFILNEHGLSLFKKEEEISAEDMHNAWSESRKISKKFDIGIEIDYCLYRSSVIGLELLVLMGIGYFFTLCYSFLHYYVYQFYMVNMELFSYIFVYLFALLSIYYWFRFKKEKRETIHRWVEIDYYFSHFLNHYFRTLSLLNIYKLADDAPIYAYVTIYTLSMIWIYFACDSCDKFMGWNQEYRIDIYNRQTNMHFWWPRILMNQLWHHFIVTIMKPIHRAIIYVFLFFFLPLLCIYLSIIYYQNKLHVYINNKYFFWNSKRYTIDEVREQWKKDKVHNYVEAEKEKNNRGGGLIIL